MNKCLLNTFTIFLLLFLIQSNAWSTPVERPPQYVLMAFDGSLNVDMWEETLNFARDNNIKFTYFLSGVYFLLDSNRRDYVEPTKGAGKSAIGFGGDSKEHLILRVADVNRAYDEGNTIGSHANGHFTGLGWNALQWELEFKEFNRLLLDVFNQTGLEQHASLNPYHFPIEEVVGFRAPLLDTNANMYAALRKNKYEFDTSKTAQMDYWPVQTDGLWNFPLAEIRLYDTGRKTLSMDYNLYYSQSNGLPDLKNADKYRQEAFKTYVAYFNHNYYGNRAPINIGHHFSKWNGGAYWLALGDFVRAVCGKPEVKCVSYKSLVNFMNSTPSPLRAEYQKGNFPKLPIPPSVLNSIAAIAPIDVTLSMKKIGTDEIELSVIGKHANRYLKNSYFVWMLNNKEIYRSTSYKIKISNLPKIISNSKLSAVLKYADKAVLKTTHLLNPNTLSGMTLDSEDLEDRAIHGDLPEDHAE